MHEPADVLLMQINAQLDITASNRAVDEIQVRR